MKRHNGVSVIDTKTIGTRKLYGTDWPINVILKKDIYFGKITWNVAKICNGICETDKTFTTKKDAVEYYNNF